jgi:thiamine-monophosphate kinase
MGEADAVVTRGGAKPGDIICVSGTLGDAAAGLRLLLEGGRTKKGRGSGRLLERFLDPEPRLALGRELARRSLASAMIDISDGLSVDLGHLCEESGTGAVIELGRLPVSAELRRAFPNPWPLALHGGEDFELLFTVPPVKLDAVLRLGKRFPATPIGIVARGREIIAVDPDGGCHPLRAQGFEHFRPGRGAPGRRAKAARRRRR